MRSGEEFSELAELGSSYVGNRYATTVAGGGGVPPGGGGGPAWSRTPGRSRIPAEAEDALGPNCSPRSHHRGGRTGLYYSPPGTSYTIIERPSSAMHHHSSRDYNEHHYNTIGPRGTYLGSNPNFHHRGTPSGGNNKKRPISPEQVLRLFGNNSQSSNPKLNMERSSRRSPASSPPSTTHQSNYRGLSLHELSTRTITMVREPADGTHGFGICVKGGKEAGRKIVSGVGVYISRVEEGSVAERAGLRPGDSILEVNGTPFTGISHEEALKVSVLRL
ncbi:pdz domain containing whirlin and harmonin-related [Holotrichia oblita]|uniref:Pdz domain containing whirlin and harmonin-related n=1 Tax=Holotrichia oblita TaxID=644536 RepID=A0ACB9TCC6_HOLOL|nr:pdz domain containing whirlin and harmonin-related [Holotrichia oblita]